jgi:hypothetical protein
MRALMVHLNSGQHHVHTHETVTAAGPNGWGRVSEDGEQARGARGATQNTLDVSVVPEGPTCVLSPRPTGVLG